MKTISDRHYEMMHPTRPSDAAQDMAMSDVYFNGTMVPPMNQVIHVYISVSSAAWTDAYHQQTRAPTEVSVLSSSAYSWGEARPLRTIDPTVTFTSPAPLTLYSSFAVYCGPTVVHMDQPMPMRTRTTEEYSAGPYLHYTSLAPGYWDTLCLCTGALIPHPYLTLSCPSMSCHERASLTRCACFCPQTCHSMSSCRRSRSSRPHRQRSRSR